MVTDQGFFSVHLGETIILDIQRLYDACGDKYANYQQKNYFTSSYEITNTKLDFERKKKT